MSLPNECHGDEDEIAFEYQQSRQAYEDEHADDWKYDPDNW
jgi:hypothetical protein